MPLPPDVQPDGVCPRVCRRNGLGSLDVLTMCAPSSGGQRSNPRCGQGRLPLVARE